MTDPLHASLVPPSAWVARFAGLIGEGGRVLDYACGGGRHARWLAARGLRVEALDRDPEALRGLHGLAGVQPVQAELEAEVWPLAGRCFEAVIVTNYLFRPRLGALLELLGPGGVLIYETFMVGNERYGKPSNPDFLLRPNELLECLRDGWTIVAFEQGEVQTPRPAAVQRVCAVKGAAVLTPLPPG